MPMKFPVPGCEILRNGAPIDEAAMANLLDVTVRDSLLLPDTAVVRFRDPEGRIVNDSAWDVAVGLEIKFAAKDDTELTSAFVGEIVAIEPEYSDSGLVVAFRAYDKGWRLNRARKSATFKDVTAADMIKRIAGEEGLSAGTIDSSGPKFDVFQQSMETNWEFCWRLARMHNCEFLVQGTKCHFRKRDTQAPAATLVWKAQRDEEPLLSFKPRLSGMGQVKSVEVRNHDPGSRQVIAGKATSAQIAHTSDAINSRSSAMGNLMARDVVVSDRIAGEMQEATALAQSTLDRLASSFVEADGKTYGNPRVRAGSTVKLEGVHRFSGEYVLSETTHRFAGGEGRYLTSFVISGRTSHRFRDLLKSSDNTDWSSSLVIGIVTNNIDKDRSGNETNMGRVKVKYPGLGDEIESGWARVVVPHAGKDRGFFFLPQVDDEVVVAFEHGDTRRPLVIGCLYNGKDKVPPELLAKTSGSGGKEPLFGVKTPHESFVDSKQQMTLRSHEKMTVEIKKDGKNGTGDYMLDAAGKVEQKAASSFKQTSGTTFDIEGGSSVTIKGQGSVTVQAAAGLTLKGATVDIQASGPVNVKGSVINLG